MKVVINTCYGGFSLSPEALLWLCEKGSAVALAENKPSPITHSVYLEIERNDPLLIQCVEELGEKANGGFAKLKIVEVPDDLNWEINYYDGKESVREISREYY